MDERTSTFALLEKARLGDRESLSRMFEKHRRRLATLIHFKLSEEARGHSEVEDILQETLLRAFKDLDGFRYQSPGSFVRWLSSIADHVIVDRVRYHSRERRAGEEIPFRSASNPAGPDPRDSNTPSRVFSQRESVQRLMDALEELPDDYRQVILMAKIEGLPTGEIAERMGRSREGVALLVYRAVKRLGVLLARHGA
jgi:RNA polymerase sigma-70 factor, ECF subfamily